MRRACWATTADPDGDPLSAVLVTGPSHGTVTLNANGSFTYTPAADYDGTDSFTYRANDGTLKSNQATVTITVTASQRGPDRGRRCLQHGRGHHPDGECPRGTGR